MTPAGAVVLIVDDNESSRYIKTQIVRRAGYTVVEAASGLGALEMAHLHDVDAILLDVNLPDISGLEVCHRLKADDRLSAVPVLQISATATTDADRVRGLAGGADAYLIAPGDPDVMVATLRALLRMRRAEQDLAMALVREREAREMAESANQAKDEFLATLSHELRTPLNALLGWVSQLRTGVLDENRKAHAIEAIERSARIQWRLVNEMLDAASIRQRKLRLEMTDLSLHTIGATAVEFVRPDAARKDVEIEASLEPVQMFGDPARLQQVITNLLNNAVQFTASGGLVSLTVGPNEGGAQIRVEDTGIGIEPEFLPFVFDEFRQADSGKVHGGLGLGLAISRHIVEAHGGRITAHSRGRNRGAVFIAQLPLTPTL